MEKRVQKRCLGSPKIPNSSTERDSFEFKWARKSIKKKKNRITLQRNSSEIINNNIFMLLWKIGTFWIELAKGVYVGRCVNGTLPSSHCQLLNVFEKHIPCPFTICLAICIWIWIFWYMWHFSSTPPTLSSETLFGDDFSIRMNGFHCVTPFNNSLTILFLNGLKCSLFRAWHMN